MSDLIKEAIADAKAVREMAVKQAKAALEEAFAPQVDAIISKRLQTEMDDEEYDDEEYDDEEVEEAISPEGGVELGTDDDHDEAQENSGLTEDADTSGIGTGDNKEPSKNSSEETTEDPGGTQDVDSDHDNAKESDLTEDLDEDVDLDEIIKELEEEADLYEDDDEEFDDEEEVEVDVDVDGDGDADIEVEPAGDEDDDDSFEDDDVEEDLELEIEDDSEEFGDEDDVDDDEELDLEAFMDEAEDEEEFGSEEDEMEMENIRNENKQLRKKMKEALKVVKFQKDRLNEINILNAKLLFTNKIFGEYNLDDASKIKVIENFDRAKTVREIKLIFATLMENMKADKRSKTSPRAQRLVEGASKAMGSTQAKKTNLIVEEQDNVKDRVHKLMGWKNK